MELQTTTIKFVDNSAKVLQEEQAHIDDALTRMGDSILNLAQMYAPVLTGALRADGRVVKEPNSVTVRFGGFSVPYARRRHYENNKHPDTKYYLERAGNQVAKQGVQYYL
jgi:hypothetical protein